MENLEMSDDIFKNSVCTILYYIDKQQSLRNIDELDYKIGFVYWKVKNVKQHYIFYFINDEKYIILFADKLGVQILKGIANEAKKINTTNIIVIYYKCTPECLKIKYYEDVNITLYCYSDLQCNILELNSNPEFELLTEQQKKDLPFEPKKLPKILLQDIICKCLNVKVGDVIKSIRNKVEKNGVYYRYVTVK